MRELAKKRLQGNFQQSAKYLALVFNDFFVLALIFIFGAVMFWYAQVMKVLPVKAWYYPWYYPPCFGWPTCRANW